MSDGIVDGLTSGVPAALALANRSNSVDRLACIRLDGYML
jgi:hypothetical protein